MLFCPLSEVTAYSPFDTLLYDITVERLLPHQTLPSHNISLNHTLFFIGLSPEYRNDNLPSRPLSTLTIILSTYQRSRPIARFLQSVFASSTSLGQTVTTTSQDLPSSKTRLNSRQLALPLRIIAISQLLAARRYSTLIHTTIAHHIFASIIFKVNNVRV